MTRVRVAGGTGEVGREVVSQASGELWQRSPCPPWVNSWGKGRNLAPGERYGRETFDGWLEKRTENL